MGPRPQRTLVSSQAIGLTAKFDGFFCHDNVSGYVPHLAEPAGESTGGGKQAVQHIILKSVAGMGPPVTAGWVNCATKEAKIRTLGCIQAILTRRSKGHAVRIDPQAYRQFFDKCWKFLESQGLQPAAEHEPPELAAGATPARRASGVPGWAWVVMLTLLVIALVLVMLLVSGRVGFGRG